MCVEGLTPSLQSCRGSVVAGWRQGIGQAGGVAGGVGVHRESIPPESLQDGPGCVSRAPLVIPLPPLVCVAWCPCCGGQGDGTVARLQIAVELRSACAGDRISERSRGPPSQQGGWRQPRRHDARPSREGSASLWLCATRG
jgi:hypothetical protein